MVEGWFPKLFLKWVIRWCLIPKSKHVCISCILSKISFNTNVRTDPFS
jgi:hypothetical protein